MKKASIYTVVAITLAMSNKAVAQQSADLVKLDMKIPQEKTVFKAGEGKELRRNEVNIHAQRNFMREYKNVSDVKAGIPENVRWEKNDKNFLVKFSVGDLEKRALFNSGGNMIYEISYGKEKHLPVRFLKELKRNYVEFTITSATLVKEANRSIWVINLEDDIHYLFVRIENDELEEVKKYFKPKL